jgi:hypothetical protein
MPAKKSARVSGISAAALRGARAGESKAKSAKRDARTVPPGKSRQVTGGRKAR